MVDFNEEAPPLKAVTEEPLLNASRHGLTKPVTYSRSITLVLTHACPWHCRYCGFRKDGEGLIAEQEVERVVEEAKEGGAREVLLLSGERPGTMGHIREELRRRGWRDFWDFAGQVAEKCAQAGLFPHGNFGRMTEGELERLRPHFVSMGLMLESAVDDAVLAPEKKVAGRVAGLVAAGRAKVPFTSGILVGWGEGQASRLQSLKVLAQLHSQYGHLQEILIQRYVPNSGSSWPGGMGPSLEEYHEMVEAWREWAPGVAVQIPPNLEPRWKDLLGACDDLGGISWEKDEVNPERPWQRVEFYEKECAAWGRDLVERLPVYASHSTGEWLSPRWQRRVEEFWEGARP